MAKTCSDQEDIIKKLQDEINSMKDSKGSRTSEVSHLKSTISSLKRTVQEQNEKYRVLEQEQEDLLLCLADQEAEMEELKNMLRKYGVTFDEG